MSFTASRTYYQVMDYWCCVSTSIERGNRSNAMSVRTVTMAEGFEQRVMVPERWLFDSPVAISGCSDGLLTCQAQSRCTHELPV